MEDDMQLKFLESEEELICDSCGWEKKGEFAVDEYGSIFCKECVIEK